MSSQVIIVQQEKKSTGRGPIIVNVNTAGVPEGSCWAAVPLQHDLPILQRRVLWHKGKRVITHQIGNKSHGQKPATEDTWTSSTWPSSTWNSTKGICLDSRGFTKTTQGHWGNDSAVDGCRCPIWIHSSTGRRGSCFGSHFSDPMLYWTRKNWLQSKPEVYLSFSNSNLGDTNSRETGNVLLAGRRRSL